MSESDEWTSEIKGAVLALVRKAVHAERDAIARQIEGALHRRNWDDALLLELLSSVANHKLKFHGETI